MTLYEKLYNLSSKKSEAKILTEPSVSLMSAKRISLKFLAASIYSITLLQVTPALASTESVYVSVRDAKLRPRAEFFSPGAANVAYGDKLDVIQENGAWFLVKNRSGQQGYIHKSAISERRIVLNSSAKFQGNGGNDNDVVLAGKGFNAEVEKKYAGSNRSLNFAAVNSMEQSRVTDRELAAFITAGHLAKSGS